VDFRAHIKIYQPGLKRRDISFKGKFNASKAKCFLMLAYSAAAWEQEGWLTARQLAWLTGLSYASLMALLPKWKTWRYLERQRFPLQNSPRRVFCYRLAEKGHGYLKRHEHSMPLDRYESEMEADRKTRGYE